MPHHLCAFPLLCVSLSEYLHINSQLISYIALHPLFGGSVDNIPWITLSALIIFSQQEKSFCSLRPTSSKKFTRLRQLKIVLKEERERFWARWYHIMGSEKKICFHFKIAPKAPILDVGRGFATLLTALNKGSETIPWFLSSLKGAFRTLNITNTFQVFPIRKHHVIIKSSQVILVDSQQWGEWWLANSSTLLEIFSPNSEAIQNTT